jgi:oligoendopeptidase F
MTSVSKVTKRWIAAVRVVAVAAVVAVATMVAAAIIAAPALTPAAAAPAGNPAPPPKPAPTAQPGPAAKPAPAAKSAGPDIGKFVPDANMERADVPDQFKWSLAALFPSDDDFARGLAEAAADRTRLAGFEGKLGDPALLSACLDLYFETRLLTNRLSLYGNLRFVGDQASSPLQALHDQGLDALNALMSAASFIRREVLALPDATLAAAYGKQPKLAGYRPYVDAMRRRRARVFDAKTEQVLALAGDNLWAEIDLNEIPSDQEKSHAALLTDLVLPKIKDEAMAEVQLTLSNYGRFRSSPDRRVRRDAVAGLFGTLKTYEDALAATLAGQMRLDVFMARARGYDTALSAYLDKDDIDTTVYRNLISAVHDNLGPLHDYVAMRKKVMGLADIHVYDLYTPLVPGVTMTFPYEEAQRLLPEALAPLGPDYVTVLRRGLELRSGWIDVYPNRNKESGAFSSAIYRVHPFVKINYLDQYDDLSTLAHEMGHAMHSWSSSQKQPYVTSSYVAFLAEIASTVNEKLLSDYMLSRVKNDDERLYLLNRLVESLRTTIYRQALFAEFELLAHEAAEKGTPMTAEFLDATYRGLVARYYGPDLTIDPNDATEWGYIPHFFYKYYVYAYATGMSSAVVLAENVRSGDAKKRDAYLGMLAAGSSKPPLDILRDAGVDLTRPDAVVAAAHLMDRTIKEMQAILAKKSSK